MDLFDVRTEKPVCSSTIVKCWMLIGKSSFSRKSSSLSYQYVVFCVVINRKVKYVCHVEL